MRPGRSTAVVTRSRPTGTGPSRSTEIRDSVCPGPSSPSRARVSSPDGGPPCWAAGLHGPADGAPGDLPASWVRGYVDHVTWSWVSGAVPATGAATVWMRPTVPLLPDEPLTGLPMLMTCVDSASGISAALDPATWSFMNTEITVHLLREPVGDWVCVDAETTLGPAATGIATATVHDEVGLVARTTQSLLVTRRG